MPQSLILSGAEWQMNGEHGLGLRSREADSANW